MDISDYIGLVGSFASIGAAVWSFFNVGIIRETKREIFNRLKMIKYSDTNSSSQNTIDQLRKVANKNTLPRGLNISDIIDSLNNYYENLNKVRNDLEQDGYTKLELSLSELKNKINYASKCERKEVDKVIKAYTELYYLVLDIDSEIGKHKNRLVEK